MIDVNLKSAYNFRHALIRPMMKARFGKIINITSVVGLTGNMGQVNYSSSKAGLIGLTKSVAKEVATRGICVNAIAPGFIETEMTSQLKEEVKQAILNQIPMKRIGNVEDIAKCASFLASKDSDYITGQVFTVDGGMTT
ncbi:MAG: 3-oxoacyl-[acyl-carrier-protein] reductase FabG [Chlamydiae bacterium]|nr:3-oxoacyl-[acyl-carrier-protein] reductase FabG [Chlamydiota bacterium]